MNMNPNEMISFGLCTAHTYAHALHSLSDARFKASSLSMLQTSFNCGYPCPLDTANANANSNSNANLNVIEAICLVYSLLRRAFTSHNDVTYKTYI